MDQASSPILRPGQRALAASVFTDVVSFSVRTGAQLSGARE